MDARLLESLVCPLCKGQLTYDRAAQELVCSTDKLAYPIEDGIPVMLADEARTTVDGRRVDPAGPVVTGTPGATPSGTPPAASSVAPPAASSVAPPTAPSVAPPAAPSAVPPAGPR